MFAFAEYNRCDEEPGYCLNSATCEQTWTSTRCHCTDRLQGDRCEMCTWRFQGDDCQECAPRFQGDECQQCALDYYGSNCGKVIIELDGILYHGGFIISLHILGQGGTLDQLFPSSPKKS